MAKLNTGATIRITDKAINKSLVDLLGGKFRHYREAWNNAGPDKIPDFPINLDIELIDQCNQNCIFCARNKKTHPNLPYSVNTGERLGEDIVDRIIGQTSLNGLCSVNIAWGEPLLYKNVFNVIKKFHSSGVVDSRLVTNGLLLDRFTDDIFNSGLVNLYVSIDASSQATYSRQRGRGYRKVVDNLLTFIDEKRKRRSFLPVIRVSFVETKENKHEVETFKNFWSDKVDIVDIQILTEFNKSDYKSLKNKKWSCIEPFRRLSVMANGDILPCCTFFGKNLVIGNIFHMSIKEAWDSQKMRVIRDNLIKNKEPVCLLCQGC